MTRTTEREQEIQELLAEIDRLRTVGDMLATEVAAYIAAMHATNRGWSLRAVGAPVDSWYENRIPTP